MPKTIQFLITFDVKPDRTLDFIAMPTSVQTDLPKVEGCKDVRIFRHDEAAPNSFTLLETWDTKPLHQAHVARLQDKGDWATIEAMLVAPPQGHYLRAF